MSATIAVVSYMLNIEESFYTPEEHIRRKDIRSSLLHWMHGSRGWTVAVSHVCRKNCARFNDNLL